MQSKSLWLSACSGGSSVPYLRSFTGWRAPFRLTVIILFTCLLQFSSNTATAQSVTVSGKNLSLG
ncbi:hypothetical protein, partial [Chitinophaga sp.]|uniref:hypothetical protein n=1 Tax=Chitinophaga sp. TaxID=1869181 RepID=UPI002C69BB25